MPMTEREIEDFRDRCRAAIIGFAGSQNAALPAPKPALPDPRQSAFDFEASVKRNDDNRAAAIARTPRQH